MAGAHALRVSIRSVQTPSPPPSPPCLYLQAHALGMTEYPYTWLGTDDWVGGQCPLCDKMVAQQGLGVVPQVIGTEEQQKELKRKWASRR